MGANLPLGDQSPTTTLRLACSALCDAGLSTLNFSKFYATPCFPAGAGPDYVNVAAAGPIPVGWDAARTLALLHLIEDNFGRKREQRWGMRTLDLDLVAFGATVLPDVATQTCWRNLDPVKQRTQTPNQLILPHPRLQDRAFFLVPLVDVAPDWRHPLLGLTILEMLAAIPASDHDQIVPLAV